MVQHHPDELEPIYYGLQLSIISQQQTAYGRFRKMAVGKKMPAQVLLLLDFMLELIMGDREGAYACLETIRARLTMKNHYLILIEYLTHDAFSADEKQMRNARKVLMDSLDQYCLKLLMMK